MFLVYNIYGLYSKKKCMKEDNLNIGLLGGSFNPPHKGHLYISHDALKRFNLDFVWWIITPHNPLKKDKPPSMVTRKKWCEDIIDTPKIKALDIEKNTKSNKTIDFLRFIKPRNDKNNYIWIMGLDNLLSFDRWSNWQEVLKTVKIAVYKRPGYKYDVPNKEILKYYREPEDFLKTKEACWSFFDIETPTVSSTEMRKKNAKTE